MTSFKERSRARVVTLQSGDAETLRLWRVIVDQSVAYLDLVYQDLGITLTVDDVVGESFYDDMLDDVVADLDRGRTASSRAAARCASSRRASPTATARRCRSSCERATRASATPRATSPRCATA